MAFMTEAGSDLYGTKHNILLTFDQPPTVDAFVQNIQAQFDVKARACRPAGYPDVPFTVETLQIFGEQGSWVDLLHDHQLRVPQSQVWVFQPESIWHSDAQGVIPKAENATQWAPRPGMGSSPSRGQTRQPGTDQGCPPTLVEKMTACFHEIDGKPQKGYLLRENIDDAFGRAGIQLNRMSQGMLGTSGHIIWDQWQQFAIKNPDVVDALFFRLKDSPQYQAPAPQAIISRQLGYPGSPTGYPNPPVQQNAYPSPYSYQGPQQGTQQSYQPPPQQSYQPPPQQSYQPQQQSYQPQQSYQQPPPPQGKTVEQEVREYINQTSPERLREGSPSRLPSQDYMNLAISQSQQPGQPGAPQQYGAAPPAGAPRAGGYSYTQGPPAGAPPMTGGSPGRQRAMQDYESARKRADDARIMKEEAERAERTAWDSLYKQP